MTAINRCHFEYKLMEIAAMFPTCRLIISHCMQLWDNVQYTDLAWYVDASTRKGLSQYSGGIFDTAVKRPV